jgi:AraC-like DNA-binding protein
VARPIVPLDAIDAAPGPAFGLSDELAPFSSEWHAHAKHQLLYAAKGAMRLAVAGERWLLPPQRGAWIRAGTRHRVESAEAISLRTVYLSPDLTAGPDAPIAVFDVTPLAREMIVHAMRWGPGDAARDALARAYFTALAGLAVEWAATPKRYSLPAPRTAELARAVEWALAHLDDDASLEGAAAAAHVSPRTLSRRFEAEARMSWRQFLHDARMLRAMEALAVAGASATRVALEVGFRSQAAFTRAFTAFTGETPSAYRKRFTSP